MVRPGLSMLTAVLLTALWGTPSLAVHRLQWKGSEVAWHRVCAFSHSPSVDPAPHRFCVIRASFQTLARADASLYAVFLDAPSDLERLQHTLENYGGPAAWSDQELPSRTVEGLSVAWVPLDPNGAVTLRVDEAHQPGKALVALVNAEGEILGTRSLWSSPAENALFSEAYRR